MKTQFLTILLCSSMLVACATGPNSGQQNNEATGAVIGGILGGFLGSQFGEGGGKTAAAIGGALAGAWVGKQVVRGMSAQDRVYYDQAAREAEAVPIGQTVTWNNPQSGAMGTITPMREGRTAVGEYCREYQQTIVIDGQTERAFGTACQQADGSWRIVN